VLIGFVHFVPTGGHEAPIRDIYGAYASAPAGILALAVLAGLISSVVLLALTAFKTFQYGHKPRKEDR
jgi:hypothetical protein